MSTELRCASEGMAATLPEELPPSTTLPATSSPREYLDALRALLKGMQSVLVCYSGGIDSALVLAVAHEQLAARGMLLAGAFRFFRSQPVDARPINSLRTHLAR